MKFKQLILCCGMVSTLILGSNVYAAEVDTSKDTINITEQQTNPYIDKNLLLSQMVEYVGEISTSFIYNEGTNLSFFIKNNGNHKLGYSVKGPHNEPIIGGYLKPGEQKINVTNVQTAVSPLPKGTFKIYISNDDNNKAKGGIQVIVKSSK
ncbi:hypothetical protein [Bacillus cereus]|uniref:hypothetical protein n=1 Tax=Bacillus cereus group TaxID=86661 RepID=UPI000279DF51|nr:hypothetical protein [Bacillus cereus]EJR80235.1 hypothetical protein IKA_05667 [Bacillus cereus VD169]HDR6957866.1 hypothetical protein [Bacillus cereus]